MVEPPPPPSPPEAAPPPPPPDPGRCPNCGAPHDVYQEYCLECGRRLPGAYVVGGRYAEVWRRDSPIWLWAALAALLLVALVSGAVVALAATDDGKSSEPGTSIPVVSTAPSTTTTVGVVTTPPTITINPPTTTLGTTTFSTTTFGTTTFGTTTTTGSNVTWPPNKDGFTVVLKSVPTSKGRSRAEAAADKARTNGLSQVGILNSTDFSSLNPGYYVTFTGIYDTQQQANAALPNARSKGFPTAYTRPVRD